MKKKMIVTAILVLMIGRLLSACSGLTDGEAGPDTTITAPTPTESAPAILAAPEQPAADLPAMTGEECAAAASAAGWSGTWGPASDGCWIISPDGSQVLHLGTWKE